MDQITAMATAAYNYFPNMSAKESAFFLMYGRDPVNKLSSILNAPRWYLCDDSGLPNLEALKNMYQMVHNNCTTRDSATSRTTSTTRYLTMLFSRRLSLVKDHMAKSFEPRYKEDYRVVQIYGLRTSSV